MTGAGPSSFFSSRVVALAWPDLAGSSPQRLWLSALLCHRIEALVEIKAWHALDPLQTMLLRGVGAGGSMLLDSSLLRAGMRELTRLGLAEPAGPGWALTAAGRQALDTGQVATRFQQRRDFCFLDNSTWHQPPQFLPLSSTLAERVPAPAGWHFQSRCLSDAIGQSPAWKRHYGFPQTVSSVVVGDDWHGVMTDFPERVYLMNLQTALPGAGLRGFAVRPGSWTLAGAEPLLTLDVGWHEVFPELPAEPALDVWRAEWLRWSQPHGLPAGEAEACQVQRSGVRILIQAPARLAARYRTGVCAEALRQEGWLLVGEGRCREAAQIEMIETA